MFSCIFYQLLMLLILSGVIGFALLLVAHPVVVLAALFILTIIVRYG